MSRSIMLIVAGALVLLSPFAGLPMAILTWILPVIGLVVVAVGISYHRERVHVIRSEPSAHEASLSASS